MGSALNAKAAANAAAQTTPPGSPGTAADEEGDTGLIGPPFLCAAQPDRLVLFGAGAAAKQSIEQLYEKPSGSSVVKKGGYRAWAAKKRNRCARAESNQLTVTPA